MNSTYLRGLLGVLDIPENLWLVDLPEGVKKWKNKEFDSNFDFNTWKGSLIHILNDLWNVFLVENSYRAKYILTEAEFETHSIATVLISCSLGFAGDISDMKSRVGWELPDFSKELDQLQ